MTLNARYQLLTALRSSSDLAYDIGRKSLALEMLGHWQLAEALVADHGRKVEAHRRLADAEADAPNDTSTSFPMPIRTEAVRREEAYLEEYNARLREASSKIAAIADALEADIERERPGYVATRQEGGLP